MLVEENECDDGITCRRVESSAVVSDGADVGWSRSGWRCVGFSGALEDGCNVLGELYIRVGVADRRWYSGILVVLFVPVGECQ